MKSFSPRFCLLGAPLLLASQGTLLSAAPADRDGAVKDTPALPWLSGLLPVNAEVGDDFSRAVTALEECRAAESSAVRRAVRGEITQGDLQTYRSATESAQRRVEELLLRKPASAMSQTSPNLRAPSLASAPLPRGGDKLPAPSPPAKAPVKSAPLPAARPVPRLTVLDHTSEGSIVSPVYSTRQMLHQPHKAGERPKITFVAMLPQNNRDDSGAKSGAAAPTATAGTKTAVALAPPPYPTRTPAPISAPLASQPPTTAPAKTVGTKAPATKAPDNAPPTKSAAQSTADLQRLAQLDEALQRADKRLNAANDALSEGQQQLTRFASTLRQAMLDAGPDAVGLHPFVKVAEKYAGTPYVWGGESRNGFDCSGMIIRVMRDLGYKALPHSAAEQFRYGKPIAQPLLKPGDLVFFANTYKAGISHVGIYLGKRRFIHAAGTGKGTIVSSLDTAKFQEKYAGARRLISARGN